MLELHRSALLFTYEPLPGAPRLAGPPDALLRGVAPDGCRFEVYVSGHELRAAPFTVEVRVLPPAPLPDDEDAPAPAGARWPTLPELVDVLAQSVPSGLSFVLPFVSGAPIPQDQPATVLFLNQLLMARGPAPAQGRPALVGA